MATITNEFVEAIDINIMAQEAIENEADMLQEYREWLEDEQIDQMAEIDAIGDIDFGENLSDFA